MKKSRAVAVCAAVPVLAVLTGVAPAAGSSSPSAVTVVSSHLDNPRGLSATDGAIYIAESGRGDPGKCLTDNSTDPPAVTCIGLTGAISRIPQQVPAGQQATATKVITGLISTSDTTGVAAGGPSAVSVNNGHVYGIIGGNTAGLPPTVPPSFAKLLAAAKAQLGQLFIGGSGTFTTVAPVGDLDFRWTAEHKNLVPDQFPDANPNGVLAAGGVRYVADAGANTLDEVRGGAVISRTFFPAPKGSITDTVPTCVDRGPDGALYVGELLGGTYTPGGARVWRVVPGQQPTVWARGLTTVNGCGFGKDGNFYAAEFQTGGLTQNNPAGDIVRISNNGKTLTHLAVGMLNFPSGFAAGDDGVYVSNCSIAPAFGFGPCPDGGQIVRLTTSG